MTARAAFPPGEASEDWAILRALSERARQDAALRHARARCAPRCSTAHPHLAAHRRDRAPAAAAAIGELAGGGGDARQGAVRLARSTDFYLTNPIARASAVMAECSALARRQPATAARRSERRDELDFSGRLLLDLGLAAAADRRAQIAAAPGRPADRRSPILLLCRPQDLGGGADAPRPQRGRARSACCSPSPTC